MSLTLAASLATVGLFAGMLLLFVLGRRLGTARLARDPDGLVKIAGPVEAAIVGLLGLVLAFAFYGAATRFETRRHLIAQEANAIGTAWLRIDSLPDDVRPQMRQLFRRYLDTRLETYRDGEDFENVQTKLAEGAALQDEIWATAASACRRPQTPGSAALLVLPALNEMIDITTTRAVATRNHPPAIIFVLLVALDLASALLIGYVSAETKVRSWLPIVVFAATMSFTVFVVLDLEFPRMGLIRIDADDETLRDVRKSMR